MPHLNNWILKESIPPELISAKELVYDICNLQCSQPEAEPESTDYSAYRFSINQKSKKTTHAIFGVEDKCCRRSSSSIMDHSKLTYGRPHPRINAVSKPFLQIDFARPSRIGSNVKNC